LAGGATFGGGFLSAGFSTGALFLLTTVFPLYPLYFPFAALAAAALAFFFCILSTFFFQ